MRLLSERFFRQIDKSSPGYRIFIMIILLALTLLGFLISLNSGSLKFSFSEILKVLFSEEESLARQIIWNIRLPRTLVAVLVGISLSLSGAVLQGVMRNPLAAPNIIGVSSGAGLAAVIIYILIPSFQHLLIPSAFFGAFFTTILVYFIAWKNGVNPLRLVLSGIAVSTFLSAGINTLMVFYPERVQSVIGFMVGGLSSQTWENFSLLWPYTLIGFILVNLMAEKMNILSLGDELATSLGLNVERTRLLFIIIASLLAASAVSIVGLLGFVGLIVPHITRLIIGSNYRYLFPGSALMGAAVILFCDSLGRIIIDPVELPVGIIMAFIGGPFFLFLLRRGFNNDFKN